MIDQTFLKEFIDHLIQSVSLFKPEFTLVITFLAALIFDIIFKKAKNISAVIALIGFVVAGIFLYGQSCAQDQQVFSGMMVIDPFGQFFKFIVLISSFFIVVISFFSKELYAEDRSTGEYYSLIVAMTFGMFLLSSATNLLMIYLAIEAMSLTSYVLAGYTKEIKRASEASLKYMIFGAVSSGLMIYGISILYGLTGTFNLFELNAVLAAGVDSFPLLLAGLMIVAGFAYKISAVPFHFWTPDVYEGAPVTITAYLAVASKAAGFAVLIRFVKTSLVTDVGEDFWNVIGPVDWTMIIAILSVLSMTLGNIVALWQTNVKRILAYSSIAHAGYILMGLVVMSEVGVTAILMYIIVYMLMNLGAFFFVLLIANKIGSEEIDDYVGLGYRAPTLSACMVLFLISLTGLPPTAGFVGKLYIFTAVLDADLIWLAVVGVLNSVISLYYYVKIFRNMYLRGIDQNKEDFEFHPMSIAVMLIFFAVPTLLFGLWWTPIANWAQLSAGMFLGM